MDDKNNAPGQAPPEEVSKSQLKREARELFKLGRQLAELPPAALADIPMDERLREAIEEARGIRSNVARKRQLGFVGKLLRQYDVAPLVAALERRDHCCAIR